MAETKSNKKDQPMLDPIAYRSDYSEENIIWNDKATTEVTDKYVWEGADNVYHPYNKNLTIDQLDANYQYGQPAKDINAIDDSYITRRNDNIASALYNEWKVWYNDVVDFLQWQKNWYNSTEEDRANTTANVWNRLWQISADNQKEGQKEEEKADTSRMESDLNKDTSGVIYGKTTADSGNPKKWIQTSEDVNSAFKIMEEARVAQVKSLLSMDDSTIAASLFSWENPYGEQAMTDFQSYYPERYANVQNILKKLVWQANVDAITSWWEITTVADRTDTTTQTTSYAVNNANLSVSATQLLKSIDTILESSDTAKSAEDLMWSIENDMAKLKNRLQNLRKEANTVFKWDAPDYLVKAWMNNKSQEIQNQLSILEDRYNAAYNRYKTELSHAEREAEMELKKDAQELEEWKAKNTSSSTTSSTSSNYTVAERNNNPLNMTVDFMKIMGWELWVDYEVSTDSFVNSNWGTQYYAKLIGDPVDTTIRVLDRAVANGMNPFTTKSWSYIWKLWLTKEKWQKMSMDEKKEMINKWLKYEWWNMDNMEYYVNQKATSSNSDYSPEELEAFRKYLSAELSSAQIKSLAESYWTNVQWLRVMAKTALENAWEISAWWESMSPYADSVLQSIAQLYEVAEKDWKLDFRFFADMYPETERNLIYAQIKSALTLEQMTEARANEIWFWQVTEWEWKMLKEAATALWNSVKSSDEAINREMERIIRVLWKASYWTDITNEDWINYRRSQSAINNWKNNSNNSNNSESYDEKMASIWQWTTTSWGWINFSDVVTNWK